MKTILQLSIAFALFLAGGKAQAQTGGGIDASFNTGTGFNKMVNKIVLQPDGKILAVGEFTTFNGQTQNRITRLNANGTLDTSFNTGIGFFYSNTNIETIALQPDGKILVGGSHLNYNDNYLHSIIRLNTDGTLDTSFNLATGFVGTVKSIAVQNDGKILVGGNLFNINIILPIARLNTDGSIDTSFNITGQQGIHIWKIALQTDGKILVGGDFTEYNGQAQNRIVRLNVDGSVDSSFSIGTGFDVGAVLSIATQPDGKILVGGQFTSYNDQPLNRIARLNTDGTLDTSFNIGSGFNANVEEIIPQPDGKILVGGYFTEYNGQFLIRLVRLKTDGSLDTLFDGGISNNFILTIALQPDGKVLVGGFFTSYNSQTVNRIVRLHGGSLSTEDFNTSEVSIYPNPVSDEFMISVPSSNIEIFDALGKKVFEQKNVNSSVNISHLSKGLYIVKGQTENGIFTTKIVKQ